jgi:hypothetical protein
MLGVLAPTAEPASISGHSAPGEPGTGQRTSLLCSRLERPTLRNQSFGGQLTPETRVCKQEYRLRPGTLHPRHHSYVPPTQATASDDVPQPAFTARLSFEPPSIHNVPRKKNREARSYAPCLAPHALQARRIAHPSSTQSRPTQTRSHASRTLQ